MELFEGRFTVLDLPSAVKICALVAQAELGDSTGMSCQLDFYLNNCFSHIVGSLSDETPLPTATFHITKNEWVAQVLKHHQSLKVLYIRQVQVVS